MAPRRARTHRRSNCHLRLGQAQVHGVSSIPTQQHASREPAIWHVLIVVHDRHHDAFDCVIAWIWQQAPPASSWPLFSNLQGQPSSSSTLKLQAWSHMPPCLCLITSRVAGHACRVCWGFILTLPSCCMRFQAITSEQATGIPAPARQHVSASLHRSTWVHLQSACTSRLSRVSCCPLPGTRRLKPAWLTGVAPAPGPLAGEGGVIWDMNLALLAELVGDSCLPELSELSMVQALCIKLLQDAAYAPLPVCIQHDVRQVEDSHSGGLC